MDDILQALAKMLNMTVDEVSSLLTTFKGNAPQIYEQLMREWTLYNVLDNTSIAMILLSAILTGVLVYVVVRIKVDSDSLSYRYIPEGFTKLEYAEKLTKEKLKNSKGTIKKLIVGMTLALILAFASNIGRYLLAPNYLFIVNEIVPKLTNR